MAQIQKSQKPIATRPIKSGQPLGAILGSLGLDRCIPLIHGAQGCSAFAKVFFIQHFHEPVSDHAQCRLGKWYFEGQGAELFAHKPGFRELDGPHKRVHESGKAALHAREQGDIKSMVEQLKTMENASMQVVHCIDRLLESA